MIKLFFILLFVATIAAYNSYLVLDGRETDTKKKVFDEFMWHLFGAVIFCLLGWFTWKLYSFNQVPFVLSSFWLIFAGMVHTIALKKNIFYVGTTAISDRLIRWIAGIFHMNEEIICAILKCLFFIGSIIYSLWVK